MFALALVNSITDLHSDIKKMAHVDKVRWGYSNNMVIPTICNLTAIFLPRQKAPQNFYGTTGQVDSPPCTIPTSVVIALILNRNVVKTMLPDLLSIYHAISGH